VSRRRSSDHPPAPGSDGRGSRTAPQASVSGVAEAVALLDQAEWSAEDVAELQEFMTCELLPWRADPDFRERLRLELWWSLAVRRLGGGLLPVA